jgi:DNA ligase D-like protein (predicted 3'-phosphoesterase)
MEEQYNKKRNFDKTDEPKARKNERSENQVFVIQKHDAQNLHYDFRLQFGDTLKSWAIPKGPSTDPAEKRMAVPTEDHPLDYADFEGVIPEEEYGGGTVTIWDRGNFENIKTDDNGNKLSLQKSYDNGTIEVWLKGEKIQGGYALIKMTSGKMKGNWLLIKMDDDEADARRKPVKTENKSVISGKNLDEIKEEKN